LSTALVACGVTSTPSSSTSPKPAASGAIFITELDSGQTFSVAPATQATLRLSNQYVWEAPRVRGTAIALEPVSYIRDPGYSEWKIQVVRSGTANISSAGTPNCMTGSLCPVASKQFEVTIEVSN
jgi:predicted secreted protein